MEGTLSVSTLTDICQPHELAIGGLIHKETADCTGHLRLSGRRLYARLSDLVALQVDRGGRDRFTFSATRPNAPAKRIRLSSHGTSKPSKRKRRRLGVLYFPNSEAIPESPLARRRDNVPTKFQIRSYRQADTFGLSLAARSGRVALATGFNLKVARDPAA
jgi:hypothetical protein